MLESYGRGPDEPVLEVFDVRAHDRAIAPQIAAAIDRVIGSGWYILGRELDGFEQAFAEWLGGGHVIGVASGTDAITLALRAAGIGPGDSVLTVPNTAIPTASAIVAAGARPIFADVDPETALLDPAGIAGALQPHTRAILPVHLYGRIAPMDDICAIARQRGLAVIEDSAQAHGAMWRGRAAGTWGDFGCFSFYPSKNLGAYGDGGAVWAGTAEAAETLRLLRNYGQHDRYLTKLPGQNSRLDEIQAAILSVKLEHLTEWNRRRVELAARYRRALAPLESIRLPAPAPAEAHVHHLFPIRVPNRERVRSELAARGIHTQIHYPVAIHLQEGFRYLGFARGDFPAAEAWCDETLSLPFSPVLGDNEIERVARALFEICSRPR